MTGQEQIPIEQIEGYKAQAPPDNGDDEHVVHFFEDDGSGVCLNCRRSSRASSCLPSCSRCGVEYSEDYGGPCQERRWAGDRDLGPCGGIVSWKVTAERLHKLLAASPAPVAGTTEEL